MSNKTIKAKRIKKQFIQFGIKAFPTILVLVSITLTSIFSSSIPFIKNLDGALKSLVITFASIAIGIIVYILLKSTDNYAKKVRTQKGIQARIMKGERVINSNKSFEELTFDLKQSEENIKREIERQKSIRQTLNSYKKLSKYEDDVEQVNI